MKTKTTKKTKVKDEPYTATIKVMGKLFTATGATAGEAILNLNTGNIKGVSILTVKHQDKTQEKIFQPRLIWQLFNGSNTMRAIALKNVATRFDL